MLSDERRYDVPITVVAGEYPSTILREWVDLSTGHRPQFSRPADLARILVETVNRYADSASHSGSWRGPTRPTVLC